MNVVKLYHRHYKILQSTCINCIIKGKTSFLFRVPSNLEWPKGFPRGKGVYDKNKTHWQNKIAEVKTRRLNAKAVLQWMYDNKRSSVNPEMVMSEMFSFNIYVGNLLSIDSIFKGKIKGVV
jgi:hypothetical protein